MQINEQTFARKIVRCIGGVRKEDIEKEARVISSFQANSGHRNIVKILGQGWVKSSFNYYFIDMELCEFTLNDYIKYHRDSEPLLVAKNSIDSLYPAFAEQGTSMMSRMHNVWAIGEQIACGLEFMHQHGLVHRDLKPCNGTLIHRNCLP